MDWSRAKNLLIILFLALNIFLAAYLFMSFQNNSSSENIANTEKVLKSRGYVLNTKIPNTSEAYKLEYENGKYDKTFIAEKIFDNSKINFNKINLKEELKDKTKTLIFSSERSFKYTDEAPTKDIDISDRGKVEKYATGFIKELKLPISNPYIDYYNINTDKSISMKFIEKFERKYIFDNCVVFRISKEGLKLLECNLVKIKGYKTKVDMAPAYQVLLKYFVDGKNSIDRIDLGYEFGFEVGVNGDKTPEWRITLGDGTQDFFNNLGQKK